MVEWSGRREKSRRVPPEECADYFVLQTASAKDLLKPDTQDQLVCKIQDIKPGARRQRLLTKLCKANQGLIVTIAKRYMKKGLEMADLIQEGNLGLLRAVWKYDRSRGFRFSTLAFWWIREAISRAVMNKGSPVRLPVHVHDELNQVSRVWVNGFVVEKKIMTSKEIATTLNKDQRHVEMLRVYRAEHESLDREISDDMDVSSRIADYRLIPGKTSEADEDRQQVHDAIAALKDKRASEFLIQRFGLRDGRERSKEELAMMYRKTKEQIAAMEKKYFDMMRQQINLQKLNMDRVKVKKKTPKELEEERLASPDRIIWF